MNRSVIRTLSYAQIKACPHLILMPEHYNADGTCKCKERENKIMAEWGYVWDTDKQVWDAPPDEEADT